MIFPRLQRRLEPRWVSIYCAKFYPDAEVRLGCPLGSIPEKMEQEHGLAKGLRAFRPWRPEVDALVILPNRLVLIEAKVFRYMDGLCKLPFYKALVPKTPELKHVAHRPIYMKLLIPEKIPWVLEAAETMYIAVETWAPDFIRQAWEERDKYWTKEAVQKREAKRQKLSELGLI